MKTRFVSVQKNFLKPARARQLRRTFESVYADPRKTPPQRFLWDHWHLENQYRMHRALARDFFPQKLYLLLREQLVQFGQKNLGCHSISEPWLSYYTEGDEQQLHTDSPHGPWAFVYSLTPWSTREFSGGETLIMRPETLNFWRRYSRARGQETGDLLQTIAPEFNQLLVFDPRLPHGVRRVSGVHDPRAGRLVVHGWFVNPEPYVTGALKIQDITAPVNVELSRILSSVQLPENIHGMLIFRLKIRESGRVQNVMTLTDTLIDSNGEKPEKLAAKLNLELKKMRLPESRGLSELTLPLIFD